MDGFDFGVSEYGDGKFGYYRYVDVYVVVFFYFLFVKVIGELVCFLKYVVVGEMYFVVDVVVFLQYCNLFVLVFVDVFVQCIVVDVCEFFFELFVEDGFLMDVKVGVEDGFRSVLYVMLIELVCNFFLEF